MIIKTDDRVVKLPLVKEVNILTDNENRDLVVNCLISYFANKKKNVCAIYDDDNILIPNKDISFIYIPFGSFNQNNLSFKEKTEFNSFLANIIDNNDREFMSIEKSGKIFTDY